MSATLLRALVLTAWAAWLVGYWRLGLTALGAVRASRREQTALGDRAVMLTVPMLTLALLVDLGLVCVDGAKGAGGQHRWSAAAGTLAALAGMAGTIYGRSCLRHCWRAQTTLVEHHLVVATGPYRLVRHPIFASALLMYAGTALAAGTAVAWSVCAGVVACYVYKTQFEDRFLANRLDGYRAYCHRVRFRLVPGVW